MDTRVGPGQAKRGPVFSPLLDLLWPLVSIRPLHQPCSWGPCAGTPPTAPMSVPRLPKPQRAGAATLTFPSPEPSSISTKHDLFSKGLFLMWAFDLPPCV